MAGLTVIDENFEDLLSLCLYKAAFVVLVHPLSYVKVLMQLGHEPLAAEPGRTLLGAPCHYRPNALRYLGHIRALEGGCGLYRAIWPCLAHELALTLAYEHLLDAVDIDPPELALLDEAAPAGAFGAQLAWTVALRAASVALTHPLRVAAVRCMAQFVGKEAAYDGLFAGVWSVYRQGGLFAGLVPRLVGDALVVVGAHVATLGVERLWFGHRRHNAVVYQLCGCAMVYLTYPFRLVSVVACVSGCELEAAQPPRMPLYGSWWECWCDLRKRGAMGRGESLWWRIERDYAARSE